MSEKIVIVPTYNEKENVDKLLEGIFHAVPDTHVLFIDDNSPDGTGELLDERAANDERVHVLHGAGKQGLGKAYLQGFAWTLERPYQFIAHMDADLSHDPAELPHLFEGATRNDLMLGSRYCGQGVRVMNWPLHRLLLSKGASYYVRILTGMPFADPTGGFKCYRRATLESIPLDQLTATGYSFLVETTHLAWMHGFNVKEHPIIFNERVAGESKMNGAIVREAMYIVWKLVFRNTLRRRPRSKTHPRSVHAAG